MIPFDSLQALSGVTIHHPHGAPRDFGSVSTDSRQIGDGAVFCALGGTNYDGHAFVAEALNRGATGAIVAANEFERLKAELPQALPEAGSWCLFGVPDTLKALQELASIHRRKQKAMIIGITGTNGKTSTKDMLAGVLAQHYSVLKTKGNFNNQIGLPLTLLSLDESHEIGVIELGANHPGEIRELAEIAEPGIGIITNAGRGHLEFFRSVEEVARTKIGLLKALTPPGEGYVNGDDPNLTALLERETNITTFGFGEGNAIRGEVLEFSEEGNAVLQIGSGDPIHMQVPGIGQAYNALAVYGVARRFGVSHEMIRRGIEAFTGNPNRGTWLTWGGFRIYNDSYNANPDSLRNALSIVGRAPLAEGGRRFALLGDMLELGEHAEAEHRSIGRAAREEGFDHIYTYGRYARYISDESRVHGATEAIHFADKADIADQVKKKPKPETLF